MSEAQSKVPRWDSFVNLLSGMGGTKDRTTQNRVRVQVPLDETELEVLYRHNHYAARVVDLVPDESTRRGFTVTAEEAEDAHPFDADLKRLGLVQALNQTDKWARLYGGAAIILGIDDGADPKDPVDEAAVVARDKTTIRGIKFAHPVDRHGLTPLEIETDPSSRGFGLPARYRIELADRSGAGLGAAAEEQLAPGSIIHASRMIRGFGVQLPPSVRSDEDWWGDSVLQRTNVALGNLETVEGAIGNIVHTFTQAVFKMKGLRNLVKAKGGQEQLLQRFVAANMAQSMLNMFIVDAEGEEYTKQTTSVAGLDGLYDRVAQSFGAAANMPLTLLFGTPPAGLATDDEAGARNWENKVRAHQELWYVPALERVCALLAASEAGPVVGGDIVAKANPLREPTEAEQATTRKAIAEAAAILIDRAVLRPDEVRNSFYGGAEFSAEITLDDEPLGGTAEDLIFDEAELDAMDAPGLADLADELGLPMADVEAALARLTTRDADPDDQLPEQQPQADVQYTATSPGEEECLMCGWFEAPDACRMVEGTIAPGGWCTLWGTRKFALDANTDPTHMRAARKRIQTLVLNGTLKPARDCKCADCGAQAREYDHLDINAAPEKVQPVCASCHHKRTNARLRKTKKDRGERLDVFRNVGQLPDIEIGGKRLGALPLQMRKQYMEVFNNVFRATKGSTAEKEAAAFKAAAGVIGRKLKE